ncbi:MAG: hypothetical protein JWP15_2201 [Alphaproteobacteria bacterium]|nr:hypothetical protein [Alphaproteobacteria bacterium]
MTTGNIRKLGYLIGSDQNDRLVLPNRKERINVVGATDLHDLRPPDTGDYDLLHVPKSYFRQPVRYDLKPYRCLLNCVTDADSNPKVLANLGKLVKGYKGRILNRPEAIEKTSRDRVASLLAGIDDLVVPATARIPRGGTGALKRLSERGALQYPAIVRAAGSHSGEILGLCGDLEQIGRCLSPTSDTIVTQFVDYRSTDGIFRKFRVFVIGGRLVFRHIVFSEQWNAHVRDREAFLRKHPDMLTEWQSWCEEELSKFSDRTLRVLERIAERFGLDFFGIDFGLLPDGRVVLFEANATMSFFPFPSAEHYPFAMKPLAPAQHAFRTLIDGAADGH